MSIIKNTFFEQVSGFNREVIGYVQPNDITSLPQDVKDLSLIQLREEVTELEEAKTATDELDALIDLIYFALGAIYKMGVSPQLFNTATTIVHQSNMTKSAGKKANRGYDGTAVDAVKPTDFISPEEILSVLIRDTKFPLSQQRENNV